MPQITFRFAAFEPDILHPAGVLVDLADGNNPAVLDIERAAPQGAPRPALRTRVYARRDAPHGAFNAFNVIHDELGHFDASAE